MKGKIVTRFIGMITVALILLALAVPVLAQTERNITLEPDSGRIGDRITITGTGFNKSTETVNKYAAIFFSSQEATTLDDIDSGVTTYERVKEGVWLNEDGGFKVTFTVPDELDDGKVDVDVTGGTYYIYVCHYQSISPAIIAPRIRAVEPFTVTKGEITLLPKKGTVGALIEVTGTDFAKRADLTFKYDTYVVPVESGNKKTSSLGGFISTIQVPESTAGPHTVTAITGGTQVSTTFSVKPEIVISPTSGEAGTRATIEGTGFGSRTAVEIWFHNTQVAIATTNAAGSFSVSFKVPSLNAGLYDVDAEGENNVAKAKFTVVVPPAQPAPAPAPAPAPSAPQAIISISAKEGYVGQGLVCSGTGFKAGGLIAIEYDDQTVATTNADSNGLFAASFVIPVSKYGQHTIKAVDGTNAVEVKFTVESTPPPIPTLLSPQLGEKLQAPITFYWTDVTDKSMPVTYELQIATSKGFSRDSIIIEKEKLTKTEYTITMEDQQRLVRGKASYYWRVRAIDAASNEGNWSSQGLFYVPAAFPAWAIYTLLVLGIILLFVFGYFLWRTNLFRRRVAID